MSYSSQRQSNLRRMLQTFKSIQDQLDPLSDFAFDTPLSLSGRLPVLNVPDWNWMNHCPDGASSPTPTAKHLIVRKHIIKVQEKTLAAYKYVVSNTKSMRDIGGMFDATLEERLCTIFEDLYTAQMQELEERLKPIFRPTVHLSEDRLGHSSVSEFQCLCEPVGYRLSSIISTRSRYSIEHITSPIPSPQPSQ